MFNFGAEIYSRHGINFGTLNHLVDIGLIQWGDFRGFAWGSLPKRLVVHYYGRKLRLDMPNETDNELDVGQIRLTKIGQELAPISGSKPIVGFYEYVKDQWKQYLPKVKNAERKE